MAWLATIDIQSIMTEDESDSAVHTAAVKLVKILEDHNKTIASYLRVPVSIISSFKQIINKEGRTDVDMFNRNLNWLYDWADEKRVWLKSF